MYYIFWVCICWFRYPAWSEHAPYCHLWHAQHCNIFPHYLINGTILEKYKVTERKMCFDFLYKFVWTISHYEKNWARHDQKCILVFTCTTSYSPATLMKLKFSWHIFEKYYQMSWKSVQWEQSCSMWTGGRTDRHDKAKSNFSQFRVYS